MNDPIRILFVDDHTLFRESVVRLLDQEPDIEVVAHCATLTEARRIVIATTIDVILLDYDLGPETGTDLLHKTTLTTHATKILMVTGGMAANSTLKAIDAGISGLVLKHSDPRHLVEAIRRVAAGETWWDTSVLHSLGSERSKGSNGLNAPNPTASPTSPVKSITERQRKVLRNILDGFTNKEIAAHLQTSETSIKASIQELFLKAGVRTRSQLVRVAIEQHAADWLGEEE